MFRDRYSWWLEQFSSRFSNRSSHRGGTRVSARTNSIRLAHTALMSQQLESRLLLSAYTVTNLNDSGSGSLRDAIDQANSNAGADTIQFASTLSGQITLTSGQIEFTDTSGATTIQGLGSSQLTISGNNSSRVFEIKDDVSVEFNGLTISGGYEASNDGGGIYNKGSLTLNNSVVSGNNTKNDGGGIWSEGSLTINNSSITGNIAGGTYAVVGGGGIVSQGTLTITNSTISNNKSTYGEGGGGITNSGTMTITNSTISDNYTSGAGGGLYNIDGDGTLINVTISGNTGVFGGGGVSNVTSIFQDASLTLTNCTISGNTGVIGQSDQGAGGIDNAATLVMYNTIVANSINSNDIGNYGDMSGDRNLVESGDTDGLTNTITATDPLLDTLADNGGPTMTIGLLAGSIAINGGDDDYAVNTNGTPLANDQRGPGFNRVMAGRVDLGAFELQNATITVTNNLDSGYGSLRDAISLANSNPGEDAIEFSSSLSGQTIILTSGQLSFTDTTGTTTITGLGATQISVNGNQKSRVFSIQSNVSVEISGLTIENGYNYEGVGGGISNFGRLTVSDSILSGNWANYGNGGAIQNANDANLTVTNTTFSNNKASYNGGAIISDGTATITGSTFINNSAAFGGAISASSNNKNGNQKVIIINSTLANNTAANGGALFTFENGFVNLINSTLSGNSTTGNFGGGGINNNGTLSLNNTIIANSTKGGDLTNFGSLSGSNNLIENGDTTGLANTITGQDPLLGALQNNGGITQTFSLQDASVAINAGSNNLAVDSDGNRLTTDQRGQGFARVIGGVVDMGAFESSVGPGFYTVTSTADDGAGSLRDAINQANSNPGDDIITFALDLSGQTITLLTGQLTLTDTVGTTRIVGLGANQLTISGGNTNRVFEIQTDAVVEISRLTISNGGSPYFGNGAGIYNNGTLTVTGSTLNGNNAGYGDGGAIFNASTGVLKITTSILSGNTAGNGNGGGGAIFNSRYGIVTITDTTISGNGTDNGSGGSIYNSGQMTITGSTLTGNYATPGYAKAGGILNLSDLTIINSTLSGNTTGGKGGGIANFSIMKLINSTLSGNTSNGDGGGIYNSSYDDVTINNTIIANSSGGSDLFNRVQSMSGSNNLIENGDTTGLTNTITGQDPMLGDLQDNGGPTWTHALLSGSSAINAGNNSLAVDASGNALTTDQRGSGYSRILNNQVDLGAFESNFSTEVTSAVASLNSRTGELVIIDQSGASHSKIGIRGEADGVVSVWIDKTGDGQLETMLGVFRKVKSIKVTLGDGENTLYVAGRIQLKRGLTVTGGRDADHVYFVHGDGSSEGFLGFQVPTRMDADVNLQLKDGDNVVKYDRISFRRNLTIKLGDGQDEVSGIAAGFAKNVNMDLGDGNDTLAHANNIFASPVTIRLGDGDDLYTETSGSFDKRWTADGGRGVDIIDRRGARGDRAISHRNFEAGPERLVATQEVSFDRQAYEINLDDTDTGASTDSRTVAEYSYNNIPSNPQPVEYFIAGNDLSSGETRRGARRRSHS
jgi:predicted outer membrane repeat protein